MLIPSHYWIAGGVAALVIASVVVLHYEALRMLTSVATLTRHSHRRRMILLILSLLVLHIVEIWMFGGAYLFLLDLPDFGGIEGLEPDYHRVIDCVYYSAMVYTTVGFGDMYPTGAVRVVTGTEAITGLTMIAWSASFTYVEMTRIWDDE
jgi:hypothetical protein